MKSIFFTYGPITITWFMFLTIVCVMLSYFIIMSLAKDYGEAKKKIEDIYFWVLGASFIGARLSYVLLNLNLYKDDFSSIFNISSYNLYLIGGIVSSLLALGILASKYNINFTKLMRIFVVPFYFSMSIGVWALMFDQLLLPNHIDNDKRQILYLSLLFLLAMIFELFLPKRYNMKYITPILFALVISLYYIM